MTTERWEQINRIFHAALERQPTQRNAFLTEACATDEALYKEVESLIVAHDGNLRWTPDGQGLLFIDRKTGDLELLPLAGGATRKLIEHDAEELFAFDRSPDGKRLAYTKGTLTSTLVLISDVK